jgi:hypothetical protein
MFCLYELSFPVRAAHGGVRADPTKGEGRQCCASPLRPCVASRGFDMDNAQLLIEEMPFYVGMH